MTIYAGLDVSDKTTHVCVDDGGGALMWRGVCATDPEAIARTLGRHARGLVRVVLETGPLSTFLYHGLVERGVAVICICARHAKGVLSARINKSDPHAAEGLAQMARTGRHHELTQGLSTTDDIAALRRPQVTNIAAG